MVPECQQSAGETADLIGLRRRPRTDAQKTAGMISSLLGVQEAFGRVW
jgi:hypothetical protein